MLIQFSAEVAADVAYIDLQPNVVDRRGVVAKSVPIGDGGDLIVDLDKDGKPIGLEFLNASLYFRL